jgi:hypothetical protein
MTSRRVGWGPWIVVGDPEPVPPDDAVKLVHLTSEEAETAEDAPANVLPMNRRGKRLRTPSA